MLQQPNTVGVEIDVTALRESSRPTRATLSTSSGKSQAYS
ncbi:MAG UNVERIFIED_CONTAM: hypothetical protein LVR29_16270 [Microcystis novacekii LVE1205-3]